MGHKSVYRTTDTVPQSLRKPQIESTVLNIALLRFDASSFTSFLRIFKCLGLYLLKSGVPITWGKGTHRSCCTLAALFVLLTLYIKTQQIQKEEETSNSHHQPQNHPQSRPRAAQAQKHPQQKTQRDPLPEKKDKPQNINDPQDQQANPDHAAQ
jgi:hypothetical protein